MRRFTLQTLRDFGVGKSSIEEKIIIEINAATKELHDTRNEPIVIAPLLQKIIGNVIYGIVFGQRYIWLLRNICTCTRRSILKKDKRSRDPWDFLL